MATEEKEKNPYEGGTGGKFRKRPFRRSQTTPYDRPPVALRNPNTNNGWISKLVDPAHRLITHGAHSLFSSLLRKRLPPPPTPHPNSSGMEQHMRQDNHQEAVEMEQEMRQDNHQEEAVAKESSGNQQGALYEKQVAKESSGNQQGAVGESNVKINCSDSDQGGLTELEKLLKQKTFTRSEIDYLTALMRSRAVDAPVRGEEKRSEMVPSEPMLPYGQQEVYTKTPTVENGIENHLVITRHVTSSVPIEDVASPAELAKAYMGSRHSNVSSSMLGVRYPARGEDTTPLKSENFPYKSPTMSIVPRATRHTATHENSFVTPRPRGRSAIYSMARTPYARIYPTSTLKGGGLAVQGEPSSSTQSAMDHAMFSGSTQGGIKRRNLAVDNNIGSVGPIRRVRQKSNLLYSKGSSSPLSGSALSIYRNGLGIDAAQQPSSSLRKPVLLDEVMNKSQENVSGTKPSTSFPPFSSKSSEMGTKILQQIDKLVSPREKSSESKLPVVSDSSSMKLSPSILRGQALRSMEMVDASKLPDSLQGNKLDGTFGNLTSSAQNQKSISHRDKGENGPLMLAASSNESVPIVTTTDTSKPRNRVLSSENSFMMKSVSNPTQKKMAFQMSAHENSLDLDDNAYGALSFSPAEKETRSSTAMADKISSGSEAIAHEGPLTSSVGLPSTSIMIDGQAHVKTTEGPKVDEKFEMPHFSDPNYNSATITTFGSDKPALPNGSIANPSLFNFANKNISSAELSTSVASSKELAKSAPVFGLEKVVPSKEAGPDASLVNFDTNQNVFKVPPIPFTASSVGGESTLKSGASFESQPGSSISFNTVAGSTGSMQKVLGFDSGDTGANNNTGFSVRASELAVSSAASTSLLTPPNSIFTFGHSSNQNNGSLASGPSFSSFPSLISNNFSNSSNQNNGSLASGTSFSSSIPSLVSNNFSNSSLSFSASGGINPTTASTGISMTTPVLTASSNIFSSSSTPVMATSSSTTSFKFGSSPVTSADLSVSSSGSKPLETGSRQDAGIGNFSSTAFGSSSAAVGSTGSGIFGFSSSAMTTGAGQSQSSFGAGSGSLFGAQTSPSAGGFATSASSPLFGLTGKTDFSSGSSAFPSSSSATNTSFSSGSSLFPSSSTTNIFNSGTTFGLGTSASSSAVNSSSGTSSSLFGASSWQPSSTSVASTSSSMFASTTSTSAPQFSFTSASTSTQPAFGSPNPAFAFGSAPVNNDQMSMVDSMAEDSVQATPSLSPMFAQQPAPVQSNFVFGASSHSGTSPFQFASQQNIPSQASAHSGANPFQFASQQNIPPQNPSPFQASGSLGNAGGGSFSLGSGGGDKSGRRIIKVKHKNRKK